MAAARLAAERPGQASPLLIYGPTATGKTHLLEGIRTAVRANQPQLRVICLTAEQFTSGYVEAAQACGLHLGRGAPRPGEATSRGVGELLASVRDAGQRRFGDLPRGRLHGLLRAVDHHLHRRTVSARQARLDVGGDDDAEVDLPLPDQRLQVLLVGLHAPELLVPCVDPPVDPRQQRLPLVTGPLKIGERLLLLVAQGGQVRFLPRDLPL